MLIEAEGATNAGPVRENNEDHFSFDTAIHRIACRMLLLSTKRGNFLGVIVNHNYRHSD